MDEKITKKGLSVATAEKIYYLYEEYYDTAKYRYHVYRDLDGSLKATRVARCLLGTIGAYYPESVTIY